jgi:hypothetical protein
MWSGLALAAAAWAAVGVVGMSTGSRIVPHRSTLGVEVEPPAPVTPAAPTPGVAAEMPVIDRSPVVENSDCDGNLPADELERGDATLRLRLLGDPDGEPVEMDVRLWRLDVAAGQSWTAGDEMRARFRSSKSGDSFARLPPGRYRLQLFDARAGAEDPEFRLANGSNDVVVRVPVRRWFRVRLRFVDERGEPIRGVEVFDKSAGTCGTWRAFGFPMPRWSHPRRPYGPHLDYGQGPDDGDGTDWRRRRGLSFQLQGDHAILTNDWCGRGETVHADAEGSFDLGERLESSDQQGWFRDFLLQSEGQAKATFELGSGRAVDTTYVGVAPRITTLLSHVAYPNRWPLAPSNGTIETSSHAIRCSWDPPADAWRTVPVHVKVAVAGYAPLEFDWTAATADTPHVLIPESPK